MSKNLTLSFSPYIIKLRFKNCILEINIKGGYMVDKIGLTNTTANRESQDDFARRASRRRLVWEILNDLNQNERDILVKTVEDHLNKPREGLHGKFLACVLLDISKNIPGIAKDLIEFIWEKSEAEVPQQEKAFIFQEIDSQCEYWKKQLGKS